MITVVCFVTLSIIIFRIILQIRGGVLLKKYAGFWGKIGVDKVLFLAPEFAPLKTYEQFVANEKNAEISRYWKSLKMYKFFLLICVLLWSILIIYGITTSK